MVYMNVRVTKYSDRSDGDERESQMLNSFRNNREYESHKKDLSFKVGGGG